MIWHHETSESVIQELNTHAELGLTAEEATARRLEYGPNHYREKRSSSLLKLLSRQLRTFPMAMVYISAIVLLCYNILILYFNPGEYSPYILVSPFIVALLPVIGHLIGAILQKNGTAKLHRLSNTQAGTVTVLRDGETLEIGAADVVRGDILFLEKGMIIPADCRLITSEDLYCDEFILTGEESDIEKHAEAILDGITPMPDRSNMVYAGCGVSHGCGTAVVVSTAQSTEYALMLNAPDHQSSLLPDLDKDISSLERLVSLPILLFSLIILIVGIVRNLNGVWDITSTFSPALAIAAVGIPAGITAASVVAMAIGMHHVVKDIADIRELSVMDTLSRVTVICADKTGVLTNDKKKPVSVFTGETEVLSRMPSNRAQTLIRLAALCTASDTIKGGQNNESVANPTEAAVIEYARDIGIDRRTLMEETPRLAEIPFDATRRCMSVVHLVAGRRVMITMGAPEAVLSFCTSGPLENAEEAYTQMANQSLRVLAVAYKYADDFAGEHFEDSQESDMIFAGLIGLADNARTDSVKAIEECAKGGIITVMMTGDNEATAEAVARELGILQDSSQLITGEALADISHEEFDQSVGMYRVFARITPEQKERIIRAWQKRGAIVAATGSELDDVPALQRADIGCAIGTADCDMTRNESDVTLYDNSFASLTDAIKQARGIYSNIRKALQYALTCSVALILSALLVLITSREGDFVLSPASLGLYALIGMLGVTAIAYEPGDRHSLSEKPQRGLYRLMPGGAWIELLWQGALCGICTFLAFDMGCSGGGNDAEAQMFGLTTAYLTLMISRVCMLAVTHRHDPSNHFSNRVMPVILAVSLVLVLIPVIFPLIGRYFGLVSIGASNWILGIILAIIPAVVTIVIRFVVNTILRHK